MDENFSMSSTKRDLLSKISSTRASSTRSWRRRLAFGRDDDRSTTPSNAVARTINASNTAADQRFQHRRERLQAADRSSM
jgi:hypothetical protein